MGAAAWPSRAGQRSTVRPSIATARDDTTPRPPLGDGTVRPRECSVRPVTRRPAVTVVGSINQDMVARVPRLPGPGQTVLGHDLVMVPGGKGLNQAVAAARAGANTAFVGMVGDDSAGQHLLAVLDEEGVDTRGVATVGRVDRSGPDLGGRRRREPHRGRAGRQRGGERRPRGPPPRAGRTGAGGPGAARDPARRRRGRAAAGPARPASRPSSTPLPRSRSTPRLLGLVDVLVVNEHEAAALAGGSVSSRPRRRTPAARCGRRAAVSSWSRWGATARCS